MPSLAEIDAEIRHLQLAIPGSELHGGLSGWLAGGGENVAAWLAPVLADPDLPAPAAGSALDRMRVATALQLEDHDFAFALLMPDDGEPLSVRSAALFDWCRGFLGGFGLATGERSSLSDEGREALSDLARLAAAQPDAEDEDDAGEEDALAELEEFVRVAVLLLHGDAALGPRHRKQLN
ncbi:MULTISPECIES: UPF0149 family protein [Luteimonas]|uniref:YecA family protein n=1 Tax=Luteimonas chenhongjianii TaxID=2006110 RepID=A0A290XHW9_9GAMM|nr:MULTISPECIES: UPF0149 family protein [Luteimonas]ATD68717.1 YecA family protein [Luteimonas chenhongjianii]RPD84634.1 YecA family protein [Luteimonas sp. 100069]